MQGTPCDLMDQKLESSALLPLPEDFTFNIALGNIGQPDPCRSLGALQRKVGLD